MKSIFLPLMMALATGCATTSGNLQNKTIVFEDTFSGAQLDRSVWNVEITGNHFNNELQAYVDNNEVLQLVKVPGAMDGALLIKPSYQPGFTTADGRKFDFVSGRINTQGKKEFTGGSISARIKLTKGIGLWPAFWMLGNGTWPDCGEIDIMEFVGENDWISAAVHGKGYEGDAALVDRHYFLQDSFANDWHVYEVEWTQQQMLFKIDGKLFFRVTKPMTEFFGKWAFDNPKFILLNFAVGGIYPYKVNGIKQPFYGLSNDALEIIKRGEAGMWVDWVRVKK